MKLSKFIARERRFTIGIQLGTLVTLLIGGISLFIFIYFPSKSEDQTIQLVVDKAHGIARMAAFSVSPHLLSKNPDEINKLFSAAQQNNKDLLYMAVLDSSGRLIAALNENEVDQSYYSEAMNEMPLSKNSTIYRAMAPILYNGREIGQLYLGLSLGRIRTELARNRTNIAIVSYSVFILGMIAVYSLATMVTRPLRKMGKTVNRIAEGDLTERISISSPAEVATLAKSFNQMVEMVAKLESTHSDLEKTNEHLEQRQTELQEEITERKRIEGELTLAKDAAEEANRSKSTFLANMSHELRTPLNAILGYSEMMIEEAEEEGEDLEVEAFVPDLERIHTAGKHLFTLISDILDISKIEAGKMELDLEIFHVSQTVQDVITTIQSLAGVNNNTLAVECDDNLGIMRADMTKIRQSLFNLLSNACKFTEEGTISLKVNEEETDDGKYICFCVNDTGIGMSVDQVAKVFQEFSQADASTTRKYGGTGLGLTICKKFCEMMGGTISVSSELGVGSSFTIRVPRQVTDPKEHSIATENSDATMVVDDKIRAHDTVLVIDDDPSVLDVVAQSLTPEGFRVVTASNGRAGLEIARKSHPDVILLDVLMPSMDGWAVLTMLKHDSEVAGIPVIMLTIGDVKEMGYALGAAGYLTKPIDRNRLISLMNTYQMDPSSTTALIIEDDLMFRTMMRRMFKKEGWSVVEAENGRVAIAQVTQRRPGLILLDLTMPEMDGFEFVTDLRKNEAWKDIPIVVVTAKDLTQEDRLRLRGSVTAILQKGAYTRDDLSRKVRELVKDNDRLKTLTEIEEIRDGQDTIG